MKTNEKYIAPESELIEVKIEGCIAMSGEDEIDGGEMH